ncbi:SOSS complex subunit B homolog isoform X1 [Hordeum vulgare subsp. vulgare]|uniref:SOSS complex subunit B homolog n=1 Tax=Hordeum vulgare subsp. vulgare TaxID=112509 RepID=A0A8I6WS05_HORVV|nr:SOSS complex subunit B homolog isoform X1 [Hordeum vulgare subsp. vulgare]XP_044976301.1 SOSS complex subunit B homolog isoform X1 [Hordeum vulgare subsp. vulgare]XP_044976306.1 SOSS complex subunit B homolog isoform X1 [Hordeum vulgare subsp. vulgare]
MDVKLKDLVPAATNTVNTTFIVVDKAARPTHANAHGREETCPLLVADETAAVHFLLWGTECDAFEPGDIVRLTSGIFSYHRGNNPFLRAGKRGRVEKVGEFTMMFVETPNMSEIQVLGKAMHGQYSYNRTAFLSQYSFYKSSLIGFIQILQVTKEHHFGRHLISPSDLSHISFKHTGC